MVLRKYVTFKEETSTDISSLCGDTKLQLSKEHTVLAYRLSLRVLHDVYIFIQC